MSFIIFPDRYYESLLDFFKRGSISLQVDEDIFYPEDIDIMKKYDFKGIFTFSLKISQYKIKRYDFVSLGHWLSEGQHNVLLAPVKLADEDFAKYFHGIDKFDENQEFVNYFDYFAYNPSAYRTESNELVDFYGNVRQIKKTDIYITDNGVNYQINPNGNEMIKSKKEISDSGYLKRMEEDCFMGKYIVRYGYNTGEIADDVYLVKYVDDKDIYFEPISLRNYTNIPDYLVGENQNDIKTIRAESTEFYIPYSSNEDITKTTTFESVVAQYKTIEK